MNCDVNYQNLEHMTIKKIVEVLQAIILEGESEGNQVHIQVSHAAALTDLFNIPRNKAIHCFVAKCSRRNIICEQSQIKKKCFNKKKQKAFIDCCKTILINTVM